MGEPERPHVVAIVGNDIATDSRVRKAAATAAAAGYRSTIVCYSPTGRPIESCLEGVRVIKVPVPFDIRNGLRRLRTPLRPFAATELAARHAAVRVPQLARRGRLEAAVSASIGPQARVISFLRLRWLTGRLKLGHEVFRVRRRFHVTVDRLHRRLAQTERRVRLGLHRRYGDPVSNMLDYDTTFGPVLEALEPDLIHAHDVHMIGVAVTAARRLRASGHSTRVVYDAHELVSGLSYQEQTIAGFLHEESEFIHHVDAVIGVSPEQVELIANRYGLQGPLPVVLNAPVVDDDGAGGNDSPTIRDVIGQPAASILVYHGNLARERGVLTLVDAMVDLDPTVHLVFVSPTSHPLADELVMRAHELGLGERVHVHGFVPADTLSHFLSTADLAVIPYERTANTDIALPNKLFEALNARLPILASDMQSLSVFLTKYPVGETFSAGSAPDLARVAAGMLSKSEPYRAGLTNELLREASWAQQADRLASVYQSLVPCRGPISERRGVIVTSEACRERLKPPQEFGTQQVRLAIGPRNSAGQAYELAGAVQRVLGVPAISFSVERSAFGFPVHHQITPEMWRDPIWQLHQRAELAANFTHLVTESGTGLIGSLNGGFVDEQLPLHLEANQRVAVLFHGSDIRDPVRHADRPFSPYGGDDALIGELRAAHTRLHRHLDGLGLPMFVTTPDLLQDVNAVWLPVVIDVEAWAALDESSAKTVPTVLHLPSRSVLKGSGFVDEALVRLRDAGLIHYLRPMDTVRAADVRALVGQADIVVDGLVIGAYGVTTCQALAAGRIVIGNTSELGSLRDECPVVHSDPDTLEATLRTLLARREDWPQLVEDGRRFASIYHDGSFSARQLGDFLAT